MKTSSRRATSVMKMFGFPSTIEILRLLLRRYMGSLNSKSRIYWYDILIHKKSKVFGVCMAHLLLAHL